MPIPSPETVSVESLLRPAGFVMASYHFHSYFELFYVEKGGCRFFLENEFHDLRAGDFILLPPQVLHYTRYMFGPCQRTALFFRRVHVEGLPPLMDRPDFFDSPRIFQVSQVYREQIEALLGRMLTEERIGDSGSAPLLELRLRELFLLCARFCTLLDAAPRNIHTTDRQILQAARYMSEHFRENITADDIAAAAGFTPNYLSRKFRESAGIGVHQYLVFLRLQQARTELLSTPDSVTDVALRCGFSSSNYFKDAFQKQYGLTPRAYRKERVQP